VGGFSEVDMGALGRSETPEARAEREAIFSAWLAGDRSRAFPGGESFAAVLARVRGAVGSVLDAASGARVAIVTHRVPILAAAALCTTGDVSAAAGACANGSVTTIVREEGDVWRLLAWGVASPLP
jgi:broad specificity phosphatase PhoE